jgi:phosphoribosylglycinamide formyltransferase-1
LSRALRLAAVASTGGAVLNETLKHPLVRASVTVLVTDRACEAEGKASAHGLRVVRIPEQDPETFCAGLLDVCRSERIDYILSYYTRFHSADFREAYRDRIVNFHPSLLPAFKGMDGFGDTLDYGVRFGGNTVEFIDQVMDEGKIILQTTFPMDANTSPEMNRHTLFVQQCRALIQVVRWLVDDRIIVDGRCVTVRDARFDDPQYSPALDFDDARLWSVPPPERVGSQPAH